MALVDFYQRSSWLGRPHDPNPPSDFLAESTTGLVYSGDPADDLEKHSVSVDIEDFMRSVLHVPVDWRARWGSVIHAVKRNPDFRGHYFDYRVRCKKRCPEPEKNYEPLLLMNDATIRAAFPTVLARNTISPPPPSAQFIHIVDGGSSDCILDDGSSIPRLVNEGELPPLDRTSSPFPLQRGPGEATSSSKPENTRKRKRVSENILEQKRQRLGVESAPMRVDVEFDTETSFPTLPRRRSSRSTEIGKRLTELLSLRPHITVGLAERDRVQLYHANHTVVLVSPVIDLSLHDDGGGIDTFIAVLIAFRYLSLHDQTVIEAGRNGMTLRLRGNDKVEGPVEVELGMAISMSSSLVGRSTAVVYGTSPKWPSRRLVVKISWVDDFRVSEREFMDKAVEEAAKPGHEWALDHLPRFYYVEDIDDPTYRSVQELLENARFTNGGNTYERRRMRIVVQEPLDPLRTLTSAKEVGQVMLDVACIHRWLYDHAGILHGDLSLNNIMCRTIKGKVHGVLTDYDLSFWKVPPEADHAKNTCQVTGTPLYMASELLMGTSTTRLYRHDVESLFYVMLMMCGCYTIGHTGGEGTDAGFQVVMREGKLPYQLWFECQGHTLGCIKYGFIRSSRDIDLSPSFEGFREWLYDLQWLFAGGFRRKVDAECEQRARDNPKPWRPARGNKGELVPFDDETLGDRINYSTLIEGPRHLTGDLEGLVIRYDPSPNSPQDATGAVPQ